MSGHVASRQLASILVVPALGSRHPSPRGAGREALGRLDGVEAVITGLAMPGMVGLSLLAAIRERDAALPVVLLTAHGSEKVAVSAMKAGAYDYAAKPFDIDELVVVVERELEARALRSATRILVAEQAIGRRIVGTSAPMRRLLDAVARVADKDVTVLVCGETGTGKELIAALLNPESRRAKRPLVRFNGAAIPGELAEAELFGHARGAFTGAQGARRGRGRGPEPARAGPSPPIGPCACGADQPAVSRLLPARRCHGRS